MADLKTINASTNSVGDESNDQIGRVLGDHGAETQLQRQLGTRHLTMIAIGSSIGMGLWLGSGTSLIKGGPASLFLGYALAGTIIWVLSHSIGEMAVMYPLPSAFVQWTGKFVDPSAAFALGWAYWLSYCISVSNELQATATVLGFWTDKVPTAGWITIFLVVIIAVNVCAVKVFGEVEVVASTIKFGWILVVILACIVISAGGAPNHQTVGFRYWNEQAFNNGFKGFVSVLPVCIGAMMGAENYGLVAAETRNPLKAVPKAISSVWIRLTLFYLLGALMVTITVSPKNPDLFGGSGTNASPYVIAFRDARLPALAHIMNVVILVSVVSSGSISTYAQSRTTMGLAQLEMAPKQFKKADSTGRPWYGLTLGFAFAGGLAYLGVNHDGAQVFSWFTNLTSLFTLFGWSMIFLSHIRFRAAWKLQGRSEADLPYRSYLYPFGPWWGLCWCVTIIILEFYLAVWPMGESPNPKSFFANYVSAFAILALFFGARIYYKGPWWVDISTVDLDSGRRFYVNSDEEKAVKVKNFSLKTVDRLKGFLLN